MKCNCFLTVEVSQEAKKTAKDNLSLLENAGMDGVFDGWKEGILAIGTFGFDPSLLKEFEQEDDAYLHEYTRKDLSIDDEDNGGDEDDEQEIEFPLVFKACKHGFFHDKKDDDHAQCHEISRSNDHEDGVKDDSDEIKKGKKEGERITLADLFWADSDKNLLKNKLTDEDEVKVKVNYSPSPESNTKHASYDERVALISKKKLTKDDAARPIKKINRVSISFIFH